jgi:hypothetical protein
MNTRVARAVFVLAATAFGASPALGAHVGDVVEAVWKEQQLTFGYRSAPVAHTCSGLRTRLRSLLTTLGVHPSMMVTVTGCEDSTRVVSITLASPVEATTENIEALAPRGAIEDLKAKVRGEPVATAETLRRFSAEWKTISFANALHLRLTPADCELLKQLRRDLMPKLTIRIVSDRMRCASDLASGHRPQLVVMALVAVPDRSAAEQDLLHLRMAGDASRD